MKTGDREYRLVWYRVICKAGLVNGSLRIQNSQVSPESGDEFAEQANWANFDASWKLLLSGSGEAKGTRFETPAQD